LFLQGITFSDIALGSSVSRTWTIGRSSQGCITALLSAAVMLLSFWAFKFSISTIQLHYAKVFALMKPTTIVFDIENVRLK
jgi:hypothetical protein